MKNAAVITRYAPSEFDEQLSRLQKPVREDMTDEEVMWYASNIRLGIKERNLLAPSHEYGKLVTISQGICNSVPISTNKLWDYMYAADNALYEVKEHRKGEIVMLHKVLISQESLDEAKYS